MSIINRIPRAYSGASARFSECKFTIASTDTGWQTYTADSSIPKNAVVEVLCRNANTTLERECGVSANNAGSPTTATRYFDLMRAFDTGYYTCQKLFVQLDGSRQFKGYAENTTDCDFVIMSWRTGVDFTEAFTDITPGSTGWNVDISVGTANAIASCALLVQGNTAKTVGVRNTSSSSDRFLLLGNTGVGSGDMGITISTLLDGSGNLDTYVSSTSGCAIIFTGEFDGTVLTYVEESTPFDLTDPTNNDTWTTVDITARLDEDGRVIDVAGMNGFNSGSILGIRGGDSSEVRTIDTQAVSATYEWGWVVSTQSNASGEIALYVWEDGQASGSAIGGADVTFQLWGYYKPA